MIRAAAALDPHVRPFTPDDLAAVVDLRRRVMNYSERQTVTALTAYMGRMFCPPGVLGGRLDSYVYETDAGEVVGFQGVVERPMRFDDAPIRVGVGAQLMVAQEHRGFAGRALVRAFMSGPQDLTLSDVANDAARRVWESLGAGCATPGSFHWTLPLRPFRHRANKAVQRGAGVLARAVLYAARPLLAAGDAILAPLPPPPRDATVGPLDPAAMAGVAQAQLAGRRLVPAYTAESIGWLLTQLREKRQFGDLEGGVVRGADGDALGWFLYFRNGGGECEVAQVVAPPRMHGLVLDVLAEHASRHGAVAITGRIDPVTLPDLAARHVTLRHEGPWVLYHSSRPAIAEAIRQGDAWLSRLDGEWWMSF